MTFSASANDTNKTAQPLVSANEVIALALSLLLADDVKPRSEPVKIMRRALEKMGFEIHYVGKRGG